MFDRVKYGYPYRTRVRTLIAGTMRGQISGGHADGDHGAEGASRPPADRYMPGSRQSGNSSGIDWYRMSMQVSGPREPVV